MKIDSIICGRKRNNNKQRTVMPYIAHRVNRK